ncbi:MAG: YabP/YqfC family sporulation protein [Clostridia bacterium]|nr:YabP/YqfC family sporulation protein [Clostridia bacterium]
MRTERKTKAKPPRVSPTPRETVELCDRGEMLICGVTGIEDYSPCRVSIRTVRGAVGVCGRALTLCWAGERRLMLRGEICQIEFLRKAVGK